MKLKLFIYCLFMVINLRETNCQKQFETKNTQITIDYISAFKDTLLLLSEKSDNELFKIHCNSIIEVIDSKSSFTTRDSALIEDTFNSFNDYADTSNAKEFSTYLARQRPFIISWVSPTDGTVSFSWLSPPKNWNPNNEYPLYIELHGDWEVASNTIEYMTYPFLIAPWDGNGFCYEDGYKWSPWGRGNLWYQGISETDIWESIAALEEIVKINPARKYLTGHSMGGFGAWYIANKSANKWAALGLHSAALGYDDALLNADFAERLKDLPTYFVCGIYEPIRLEFNQDAYNLLENAGNQNIKLVTFNDGHVYHQENVDSLYLWIKNFVNEDWNATDIRETRDESQRIRSYPNPVAAYAHISYTIVENSKVNMSIHDIYGRIVEELVNEVKNPGEYEVEFDASELTIGIYFARLKTGDVLIDSKMVVLR